MLEHTLKINLEIISLYSKDYSAQYSIKEITTNIKAIISSDDWEILLTIDNTFGS